MRHRIAAVWVVGAGLALAGCHSVETHEEAQPEAEPEVVAGAEVEAEAEVGPDVVLQPMPPSPEVAAMFERLKGLEGTWQQVAVEGDKKMVAPAGTTVSYRLTSGGSAVIETIFEGQPHEMVTVYYVDNGTLKLTHYCAMGNQPHMVADPPKGDDEVSFTAVSVGNTKSENDAHMHWGALRFVDANHLQTQWTIQKDGKPGFTAAFDLERMTD